MSEAVDEMLAFFESFEKAIKEMNDKFTTITTDKAIPLDERWDLFRKAPEGLTKNSPWYVHFEVLAEDNFEFSWASEFHCDRHQLVFLSDFVSNLVFDIDYCQLNPTYEPGPFISQFIKDKTKLDRFKEEILKSNISSFTFDW